MLPLGLLPDVMVNDLITPRTFREAVASPSTASAGKISQPMSSRAVADLHRFRVGGYARRPRRRELCASPALLREQHAPQEHISISSEHI
jgi:hypothetical protein